MAKAKGFLEYKRQPVDYRPIEERVQDFKEIEIPLTPDALQQQAARCADCGIPFCHSAEYGCPVANRIPEFNDLVYLAGGSEEHFLSFVTPQDDLAGYLRLSLPGEDSTAIELPDLNGAALVREVHVYGQSLEVGQAADGAAQHIGLGTELMKRAEAIARERGFHRVSVIAALGTRGYYRRLGYTIGDTYMVKQLT